MRRPTIFEPHFLLPLIEIEVMRNVMNDERLEAQFQRDGYVEIVSGRNRDRVANLPQKTTSRCGYCRNLRVHSPLLCRISHAIYRQHIRRYSIVDAVLYCILQHIVEAIDHDSV